MIEEPRWMTYLNKYGDGYAVMRLNQAHKRAHLWKVEGHNKYESVASFTSEAGALAFIEWLSVVTLNKE